MYAGLPGGGFSVAIQLLNDIFVYLQGNSTFLY
jgi:hypothetical protein